VGASDVAGAGVWAGFGCLLAAVTVGRGDGEGVAAAGVGWRGAGAAGGSAAMMLTGGVEAALGNSALVGRPVGTPGIRAATGGTAGGTGAFQAVEYRATRPS
jgi:hypothetical protein